MQAVVPYSRSRLWRVFTFLFFFIILGSPGGIFRFYPMISNIFLLFFSFLLYITNHAYFKFTVKSFLLSLLFIFTYFMTYVRYSNFTGMINALFYTLFFLFLFALQNQYKSMLLKFLTKWFSIFCFISFCAWGLHKAGMPFPSFQYIPNEALANSQSMYVFKHYYFFLTFDYDFFNVNILPRFQAFFIEPSYLGTTTLLFIAANDFNFKNPYILLLLCIMLSSCSLAAYLIFAFVYLFHLFLHKKYRYVLFAIVFGILALRILFLLPQDSLPYRYIVMRLFTEDGIAYNRSSIEFSDFFWKTFCKSKEIFLGSPYGIQLAKETNSVDFKMFIVYYGIIGFIVYVIFLLCCFLNNRNSKNFCLTMVLGLIMLQSSWVAQYLIYSGTYILALMPTSKELDISPNNRLFPIT